MLKKILYYFVIILGIQCSEKNNTITNFIFDKGGRIVVPITIRDTTINFLFDTGASLTVIRNCHVKIPLDNEKFNVLLAQDSTITLTKSKPINISLANLQCDSLVSIGVDKSNENANAMPVLGMDVIKQFNWHFDFVKNKLTVSKHNAKVFDKSNFIAINYFLSQLSERPIVYLSVNNTFIDKPLIIDTGNGSVVGNGNEYPLMFTVKTDSDKEFEYIERKLLANTYEGYECVEEHHNWSILVEIFSDSLGNDISSVFKFKDINMFNANLKNVAAIIGRKNFQAKNHLTIHFFRQFAEMYIDTKEQVIYLKPYETNN